MPLTFLLFHSRHQYPTTPFPGSGLPDWASLVYKYGKSKAGLTAQHEQIFPRFEMMIQQSW